MTEPIKLKGNPMVRMKKFRKIRKEYPELNEVEALLKAEKECIEEGKINPFIKFWSNKNKEDYKKALDQLRNLNQELAVRRVIRSDVRDVEGEDSNGRNKGEDKR